jgi:transcriptional regulator GlxA family with amidase domain
LLNIGIFLFEKVELLDFAGPYEVFSVASELNNDNLFNVFTVSSDGNVIKTVNGLKVVPDYSFDNHPPIDILMIPGGEGTKAEINKPPILQWLQRNYANSKVVASICSGALLLGKLGFLDRLESTTHHEVIANLQELAPLTIINRQNRFISYGKIMTSAGISAGIDLSLHIVEKFCGRDIVNEVVVYLEYGEWQKVQGS